MGMLPDFTPWGDLPVGVHVTRWEEFSLRFGASTPRRMWLLSRLKAVLSIAARTGKLRRVFVWGSFVTSKASPKDVDLLLILDEDFEVEDLPSADQAVFDPVRARLLFESDVFWARASIGNETLDVWLDTYQISRTFRKRGIVELELP
jgi:predicted nucleotidyltransferase